jgi:pimeloyl-ACP methyl ester carboxylesterase
VTREHVVLVHGLYMTGVEMALLGRRLNAAGYSTHRFRYPSLAGVPAANAARLRAFVADFNGDAVHFVAHSLGGLVVRHLIDRAPDLPPGRVVTLGTPHAGSQTARWLNRSPLTRALLGAAMDRGLNGGVPPWSGTRPLGSIAGSFPLGVGVIAPDLARPNDGTVAVHETEFAGMTDHCVLPVSHFGMLFSASVAAACVRFLRTGRFAP